MKRDILAIYVGTTAFKAGVFGSRLGKRGETSREYQIHLYDQGKADIETEKWWQALKECCIELKAFLRTVGVVSFSVTTPGFVPMGEDGHALGPAILMLDGRSHKQAREIRQSVGRRRSSCRETCNLARPPEGLRSAPFSGSGKTSRRSGGRRPGSAIATPIW